MSVLIFACALAVANAAPSHFDASDFKIKSDLADQVDSQIQEMMEADEDAFLRRSSNMELMDEIRPAWMEERRANTTTALRASVTFSLAQIPTNFSGDLSVCSSDTYQTFMKTYFGSFGTSGDVSFSDITPTSTICKPAAVSSLVMSSTYSSRRANVPLEYFFASNGFSAAALAAAAQGISAADLEQAFSIAVSALGSSSPYYGQSVAVISNGVIVVSSSGGGRTGRCSLGGTLCSSDANCVAVTGDTCNFPYSGFGYGGIAAIAAILGGLACLLLIGAYVKLSPDGERVIVKYDDDQDTAIRY